MQLFVEKQDVCKQIDCSHPMKFINKQICNIIGNTKVELYKTDIY